MYTTDAAAAAANLPTLYQLQSCNAFIGNVFTQRRNVAKNVGCFQRRLFVCVFVNTIILRVGLD